MSENGENWVLLPTPGGGSCQRALGMPRGGWGMPTIAARDNGPVSNVTADRARAARSRPAPLPRRGRFWVVLILLLGVVALGYALVNIATQKPNKNTVHIDGVGDGAGTLRRRAAGRRPARLRRRAGDGPGLRRRAELRMPRRLPGDDPGADRKVRPRRAPSSSSTATTRTAKTKSSTAPTASKRRPNRATAGSTPTSSSSTRRKPTASASPKPKTAAPACAKTSSTRSPAGSRN